jgi:hypothetical protein
LEDGATLLIGWSLRRLHRAERNPEQRRGYSRHLNREGLFIAVQAVAARQGRRVKKAVA